MEATLFIATMESEHFTWMGAGATREGAHEALAIAFRKRTGTDMTRDDLDERYGIWCVAVKAGDGLCDGSHVS